MKRFMFVIFISILGIASFASNVLQMSIDIPAHYGVELPKDALVLDRFVFQYNAGEGTALMPKENVDFGVITDYPDGITFTILYYGNLNVPYTAKIHADANQGFYAHDQEGNVITIPLELEWVRSDNALDSYSVETDNDGNVSVVLPPSGPAYGEAVADIHLSWGDKKDLVPGIYNADISFELISE